MERKLGWESPSRSSSEVSLYQLISVHFEGVWVAPMSLSPTEDPEVGLSSGGTVKRQE